MLLLPEVGVCHRPAQVEEPKEVGHHGSLPEGDAVVQGAVHHKVLGILRPQPLQGHESQLKDRPEEQEPGLRRQELSPEPGPEAQGRIRRFKGLHGQPRSDRISGTSRFCDRITSPPGKQVPERKR